MIINEDTPIRNFIKKASDRLKYFSGKSDSKYDFRDTPTQNELSNNPLGKLVSKSDDELTKDFKDAIDRSAKIDRDSGVLRYTFSATRVPKAVADKVKPGGEFYDMVKDYKDKTVTMEVPLNGSKALDRRNKKVQKKAQKNMKNKSQSTNDNNESMMTPVQVPEDEKSLQCDENGNLILKEAEEAEEWDDRIDNEDEDSGDVPFYKYLRTKSVLDSDGFWTDYTMYYDLRNDQYVFIFGDNDIYNPTNTEPDWEEEDYDAATEWFDSYNGFEDDDDLDLDWYEDRGYSDDEQDSDYKIDITDDDWERGKVESLELKETPGLKLSSPKVTYKDQDDYEGRLEIEINGKKYMYRCNMGTDTTAREMADKVAKMQKFSDGKALAYLKKNMHLVTEGVKVEALKSASPYMLRNDGKLLECGDIHPYVKYSYMDNKEAIKFIRSHPENLKWFYENTLNESTRDEIRTVASSIEGLSPEDFGVNDQTYRALNPEEVEEFIDAVNDETNQEFLRVRTSGLRYGNEDPGSVYARISSLHYDWYPVLWDIIENDPSIKSITVVKDSGTFGGRDLPVKVKGEPLDHMSRDEFLTFEGNPELEMYKFDLDVVNEANERLLKGKSLREAYSGLRPRYAKGFVESDIKEGALKFDMDNLFASTRKKVVREGLELKTEATRPSVADKTAQELENKLESKFYDIAINDPEWDYEDQDMVDEYMMPRIEVHVDPEDRGRLIVTIAAEYSDYDAQYNMDDELNKVIRMYDTGSYFEQVEPGISEAIVYVDDRAGKSVITGPLRGQDYAYEGLELKTEDYVAYDSPDDKESKLVKVNQNLSTYIKSKLWKSALNMAEYLVEILKDIVSHLTQDESLELKTEARVAYDDPDGKESKLIKVNQNLNVYIKQKMWKEALNMAEYVAEILKDIVREDGSQNESLEVDPSDGWSEDVSDVVSEVLNDCNDLLYEINSAYRGYVSNAHTVEELANYIDGLAVRLSSAAEDLDSQADRLNEEVKTEKVSFKDAYICKGCGKPLSQCTCGIKEEDLKEDATQVSNVGQHKSSSIDLVEDEKKEEEKE